MSYASLQKRFVTAHSKIVGSELLRPTIIVVQLHIDHNKAFSDQNSTLSYFSLFWVRTCLSPCIEAAHLCRVCVTPYRNPDYSLPPVLLKTGLWVSCDRGTTLVKLWLQMLLGSNMCWLLLLLGFCPCGCIAQGQAQQQQAHGPALCRIPPT
jgi:hypothetical protein